jgi:hypothetical protein
MNSTMKSSIISYEHYSQRKRCNVYAAIVRTNDNVQKELSKLSKLRGFKLTKVIPLLGGN